MPSSSLRRVSGAVVLVALGSTWATTGSGCALLYDFADDGAGARGGAGATSSSPDGPLGASGSVSMSDAQSSTAAVVSAASATSTASGAGLPIESHAVLLGGMGNDSSAQRGVVSTSFGPAVGVFLLNDATLAVQHDVMYDFGVAAVGLDTDLVPKWSKAPADSIALFGLMRGLRETMIAKTEGDTVLLGGTMKKGAFLVDGAATTGFPDYRTAYVVAYNPDDGSAANVVYGTSTSGDSAVISLDGLSSDLMGGAWVGLSNKSPAKINRCSAAVTNPGVVVFHLDGALDCIDDVTIDVSQDVWLVDMQPRPDGVTVTSRALLASTNKVTLVVDHEVDVTKNVEGEMILAPGTVTAQAFCMNDALGTGTMGFGMLDIGAGSVDVTPKQSWVSTKLDCSDILPVDQDFLLVGRYDGAGFAGLPASDGDDAFLLRVTSEGIVEWAVRIGGSGADRAKGVAFDPTHRTIYVTGFTSAGFSFAGGPLTTDDGQAFVVSFDIP